MTDSKLDQLRTMTEVVADTGDIEAIATLEQAKVFEHVLIAERSECFFRLYEVHQNQEATKSQKKKAREKCGQAKGGPVLQEVSSSTGVEQQSVSEFLLGLRNRIADAGEDPAAISKATQSYLKSAQAQAQPPGTATGGLCADARRAVRKPSALPPRSPGADPLPPAPPARL